eukprot:TRINITY_DN12635_c0_g1_i1.p1 TRINITY_DN12635_c0_g1~~TRINITY_DN12635_c0_g1_i1.p1  ORF type:complete len:333 (+),score=132.23 TRINITY_DN12635_c0_g1_i1:87-1001(+)
MGRGSGKTIGRFRVTDDVLGRGSYGEVRRGTDTESGKSVAVKIIKKEILNKNQRSAQQLFREIAIMKSLSHPNIVNLYDTLQTGNNIYMVLELVDGGELFERIVERRRFDEPQGRSYFQDLIMGVRYVHMQGVAHRDLKPENILISDEGLKIADFGLSNIQLSTSSGAVPDSMQLQTVCGTPNYVAPEVLEKEGYNGFLADVWSCGVILYVMLAGYLPFRDPQIPNLLAKILKGDYEMCPSFSPGVAKLVEQILQRQPSARISIEGILKDPWFKDGFKDERLGLGTFKPVEAGPPSSVSSPLHK